MDICNKSKAKKSIAFVLLTKELNRRSLALCSRLQRQVQGSADFFFSGYSFECKEQTQSEFAGKIYTKADFDRLFSDCTQHYQKGELKWHPIPGKIDLVRIAFCLEHPEYDQVWLCEDDVRFSGSMATLISRFQDDDTDLLAPHVMAVTDKWPHFGSLNRHGHKIMQSNPLKAFMPFCRYSKRLATAVHKEYIQGLSGHFEQTWLYVADKHQMSAADLGRRWTDVCGKPLYSGPTRKVNNIGMGSFVYRPRKLFWLYPRQRLFHPVKPLTETIWDLLIFRAIKFSRRVLVKLARICEAPRRSSRADSDS